MTALEQVSLCVEAFPHLLFDSRPTAELIQIKCYQDRVQPAGWPKLIVVTLRRLYKLHDNSFAMGRGE